MLNVYSRGGGPHKIVDEVTAYGLSEGVSAVTTVGMLSPKP